MIIIINVKLEIKYKKNFKKMRKIFVLQLEIKRYL